MPLILWTAIALLWVVPVPAAHRPAGLWAGVAMFLALSFYLRLSRPLGSACSSRSCCSASSPKPLSRARSDGPDVARDRRVRRAHGSRNSSATRSRARNLVPDRHRLSADRAGVAGGEDHAAHRRRLLMARQSRGEGRCDLTFASRMTKVTTAPSILYCQRSPSNAPYCVLDWFLVERFAGQIHQFRHRIADHEQVDCRSGTCPRTARSR